MIIRKWYRRSLWLSFVVLLLLLVVQVGSAAEKQRDSVPLQETTSAKYVGVDTCKTCHDELYEKRFENTPHFKTTLQDEHGCESCHGPGSEHVEGGGDVTKIIVFKKIH